MYNLKKVHKLFSFREFEECGTDLDFCELLCKKTLSLIHRKV